MSNDVRHLAAKWLFRHDQHFKTVPPPSDFEVFAKTVLCCAKADGELAPEEREWVLGYFAALGAPPQFIEFLSAYKADEDPVELIAKSKVVDASRRAFLFDAIRACCADGTFHDKERAAVHRLADKMGVTKDVVDSIEAAYMDERRATEKRVKLLFPNGVPF